MQFREHRVGSRLLVVAHDLENAALRLGLPERVLAAVPGPGGRAGTTLLELPGDTRRIHLRPVRHGGWLGPAWGRWILGLRRPQHELRITAALTAAGAPVPRAALLLGQRHFGPFWSATLGTVNEDGAIDGASFLASQPSPERLLRAAAAAASATRRFHDVGGRHADLQIRNLLIHERASHVEAIVIDLDRARLGQPPNPRRRMAELMRLYRSLVKRQLLETVGSRGLARFLASYTAGDRALRTALLQRLPAEQRRLAIHRLGYR